MKEKQETGVWSLGGKDPLEKEMATHSSILDWEIPLTEEPGELHSRRYQSDTTEHACLVLDVLYKYDEISQQHYEISITIPLYKRED